MNTWRNLIKNEMIQHEDSFDELVASTFKNGELDIQFDDGYGGTCGIEFTLWTKDRVYFPICYDGAEWVGSASRNIDGVATAHQGGG